MSLGEKGDERAAVAVVQDHIGLDEVLALIRAARAGSMAFDALRHPHRSAAIGSVWVNHMPVQRRSIERGPATASSPPTTAAAPDCRSGTVRHGKEVEQDRPFLGRHLGAEVN